MGGLGIIRAWETNQALLASFSWRATQSNAPWAQIIKHKYLSEHRAYPSNGSCTWKALVVGHQALSKGLGWAVGNGDSIYAWKDTWIENSSLRSLIHGPLKEEEQSIRVNSLKDDEGDWNFNAISFELPREVIDKLLHIPFNKGGVIEDKLIWRLSSNGKPSVGSVYLALMHDQSPRSLEDTKIDWNWIWKVKTLPRIQTFLWLCSYDCICSAFLLWRRGCNVDPICPLCSSGVEDTIHILRDCPKTKALWTTMGIPISASEFLSIQLFDWLSLNCRSRIVHASGHEWATIFSFTVWNIWKERNSLLFNQRSLTNDIYQFTLLQVNEFVTVNTRAIPPNIHETVLISWNPPLNGWLKLNTDGSARDTPKLVGAGGIIRDEWGRWVTSYSRRLGTSNSLLAELWGLRDGLTIASNIQIDSIHVETDALEVHLVCDDSVENYILMPIIIDCRNLMKNFRRCKFRHVFREANGVADAIAKLAVNQEDNCLVIHDVPPRQSQWPLLKDMLGIAEPREISRRE